MDESGFADSEYLKDYQVYAHINSESVEFEILISVEGVEDNSKKVLQDESRRKMRKETSAIYQKHSRDVKSKSEAKKFVRTYTLSPKGRPERIVGSRDGRTHAKDARKFQKDGRKTSYDRSRKSPLKNSGERYVEHEFAATSPRGLDVDLDGKLRISLQREIRNTSRKVIFPQGSYQGIVKNFVNEIKKLIEEKFTPELEAVIRQAIT